MFTLIKRKIYSMIKISKNNNYRDEGIKIILIYLVIGFLWVYFSSRIVNRIGNNDGITLAITIYKGWLYVIVTSIILDKLLIKIISTEMKLNESYGELTEANEELQVYIQQVANSEEELRYQNEQLIESEKKLRKSEEKNRNILKAIPDLLFVMDNEGRFTDCTASDESNLLMKKEAFLGKTIFEVLPKEISKIAYEKMQSVFKYGIMENFEYKMYICNKEQYFECRLLRNNEKEILAISRNVTVERQNELKLKASEYTFRKLFESSSDAILIVSDDRVIDCNLAMIGLLAYDSKKSIIGKSIDEFSPKKQPNGEFSKEKSTEIYKYAMKNANCRFEWWYKKVDETPLPIEVMMTTILLNGKKVFHFLCRDIRERKEMEYKLQYLSYHDQLTGLYNRRFFEEELRQIDIEKNYPLTIVMADVNGLKLVNDSFGHTIGDGLLKKVVEVMKNGCIKDDVIARLAGDEFVILLPKTNNDEAGQIIKNINDLASKEKVESVDISISFGYATKNNKKEKIVEKLKKAEDDMYKKKLLESPSMRGKTIDTIIMALHEKNKREEQHSLRVSKLCERMGIAIGLLEDEVRELKIVGLLHDIGKIAIEENILNKNGKLTDEEWEEIRKHPEIGYRILSTVNNMSEMAEYVLNHHERLDGSGYPRGLKGEEIQLQSRIITIADAYDAMVSERSYRGPLPEETAIKELRKNEGVQFDSDLVRVFIEKVLN
jgi:diguanylate cyclase (GGDEF)-like protein/PAS domain S-box-containing protein